MFEKLQGWNLSLLVKRKKVTMGYSLSEDVHMLAMALEWSKSSKEPGSVPSWDWGKLRICSSLYLVDRHSPWNMTSKLVSQTRIWTIFNIIWYLTKDLCLHASPQMNVECWVHQLILTFFCFELYLLISEKYACWHLIINHDFSKNVFCFPKKNNNLF